MEIGNPGHWGWGIGVGYRRPGQLGSGHWGLGKRDPEVEDLERTDGTEKDIKTKDLKTRTS